jgi:Rps23 Pro-64 3,4-dihydroxylase Tpa1-like proline 4-hydroxylase
MKSFNEKKLKELADKNSKKYQTREPFPFISFENFLNEDVASSMMDSFPPIDDAFYKYDNPLEKKYAFDKVLELPESIRHTLLELNSPPFLSFLEQLTGIQGLIPDPYYRGGGIHQSKRGGKLDIHVDFNKHPKLGLHRRLNILIYLNKSWKEEYAGDFQIWKGHKDEEGKHTLEELKARIYPRFNTFACFSTSEKSYHGFPDEIMCPEGMTRKSIALYYYTATPDFDEIDADYHSTTFIKRPHESGELDDLRGERNKGRLNSNIKDPSLS